MTWNKLGKGIQFTKILGETQAQVAIPLISIDRKPNKVQVRNRFHHQILSF